MKQMMKREKKDLFLTNSICASSLSGAKSSGLRVGDEARAQAAPVTPSRGIRDDQRGEVRPKPPPQITE